MLSEARKQMPPSISEEQEAGLKLLRTIARGLVDACQKPVTPATARAVSCPRKQLYDELLPCLRSRDSRSQLVRDDLELLMFATRALLDDARHPPAGVPVDTESVKKYAGLLHQACNVVRTHARTDALDYLRPSYDAVLAARLDLNPANIKQLLDLTASARTGQTFDVVVREPTVVFYFPKSGKGYALLDVPGGTSRAFPLRDDLTTAKKEKRALKFPVELQAELEKLSGSLSVHWMDPVHDLEDEAQKRLFAGLERDSVNVQVRWEGVSPDREAVVGKTKD